MKLKNKMEDVRQLRVAGQIVYVQPGETIDVENARYDNGAFELVDIKKSKDKKEKPTKQEEVK